MKVVHLVTDDIGGAGRAARRIHAALQQQGVDSKVIVLEKYDQNDCQRVLNNKIARTIFKVIRKGYQKKSASQYELVRFSELGYGLPLDKVKEIQEADIVHLHWINYSFISNHALERLFKNKKIVWTLHDMWPFTAGCYYDSECGQYKKGCHACQLIKQDNGVSENAWKKKKSLYEKANDLTFVGCSKWITDCAAQSMLTKRFSCINIPNPIDTSVFYEEDREKTRKKLGAKEDEKIIVFGAMTADSDERKGYRYLLEALNELSKLEQNYRAVVFGNKGELHFDGLNIPVTGLGMIHDDNKLRKIYSAADVFVAPSVQENLSNAVMESLSCSTPVAAFDIGGMSDMIDHKETGYLAKPFDAADLAAGIAYSAAHPQMRRNARRKVEESFGMSVVGKQYKALYQKKNNR